MELAEKHHLGRKLRRSWLVSYYVKDLVSTPGVKIAIKVLRGLPFEILI